MNENQGQAAAQGAGESAGARLRLAREQAGLHLAALAVALKVPVKRMEALEADRYDLLPGPVFTRALAGSVCRILKLDPAPVLARLPQAGPHQLAVDGSLNQPFRPQGHGQSNSVWPAVSRPALIAAAVLLLAAIGVYLMPATDFFSRSPEPQVNPPDSEVTESVVPVNRSEPVPPVPEAASSAATGVPAKQDAASAAAPAALAPLATTPAPASGDPVLTFNVQRSTWVEVLDARGAVVLRRTLNAGEQVPVTVAPVLRVTVGNAGGVTVKVRGKNLDLLALAQDNVARFEVK
ncbi:MAG: helix-turn-helix domain-containing protein [Betaproteobacteria bacterium]